MSSVMACQLLSVILTWTDTQRRELKVCPQERVCWVFFNIPTLENSSSKSNTYQMSLCNSCLFVSFLLFTSELFSLVLPYRVNAPRISLSFTSRIFEDLLGHVRNSYQQTHLAAHQIQSGEIKGAGMERMQKGGQGMQVSVLSGQNLAS